MKERMTNLNHIWHCKLSNPTIETMLEDPSSPGSLSCSPSVQDTVVDRRNNALPDPVQHKPYRRKQAQDFRKIFGGFSGPRRRIGNSRTIRTIGSIVRVVYSWLQQVLDPHIQIRRSPVSVGHNFAVDTCSNPRRSPPADQG